MNYILVDTANTFFRSKFAIQSDLDSKIGMALHITFNSIRKVWQDFKGDHVVFCLEGRSWRKDFYEPYKANRKASRDALTPAEQEEDQAFWKAFDELREYIDKRTNCTVLQHAECEADDFIARWIQNHPDDKHVIVSSDSDFYQLLDTNHAAWHASSRKVNHRAIGIEIANAYYPKYQSWYKKKGFGERPLMKNAVVHGKKLEPFTWFYPVQIKALQALWKSILGVTLGARSG